MAASTPGAGQPAALIRSSTLLAFQNVPPAPGREPSAAQAPPPPPGGGAPAPQGGPPGGIMMVLLFALPILLLFFSNRTQKKQAAAISALKKGDRVVMRGGIVGRLTEVGERYAKLEIAPGVRVDVLRAEIAGPDAGETAAAADKDKDKDKDKK